MDILLVIGANDLIHFGPSFLSEGLREWRVALQTYSKGVMFMSLLLLFQLWLCMYSLLDDIDMC